MRPWARSPLCRRSHPTFVETAEEAAEPSAVAGPIDQTLLRKYITFARQTCRPALQAIDEEKIKGVYAELRRESQSGGVNIAVRHSACAAILIGQAPCTTPAACARAVAS